MITYDTYSGAYRAYYADDEGCIHYVVQISAGDNPHEGLDWYSSWEEARECLLPSERIVPPEILDAFFDYLEKHFEDHS